MKTGLQLSFETICTRLGIGIEDPYYGLDMYAMAIHAIRNDDPDKLKLMDRVDIMNFPVFSLRAKNHLINYNIYLGARLNDELVKECVADKYVDLIGAYGFCENFRLMNADGTEDISLYIYDTEDVVYPGTDREEDVRFIRELIDKPFDEKTFENIIMQYYFAYVDVD